MSTALVSTCVTAALAVGGPLPSLAVARTGAAAPAGDVAPAPGPPQAAPAPGPADAASAPTITLQPAPAPDPDPSAASATPTVAVQPAPSAPPPRPVAPVPRHADVLAVTGAVSMGVGGASLLFVAVPAAIVRSVALSRAEREDVLAFTSRKTRYERARVADDVMEGGFWIGLPLLLGGTALLVAGLSIRASARLRSRMAATAGGMVVRF
jgi:hypothetical protein